MPLNRLVFLLAALVGAALACPKWASAQTCSASAPTLAFGNYRPSTASPTDTVGTITLTCSFTVSLLVTATVALSAGSSGSYTTRYMTNGANNLRYQVYTSSSRTQVWGDGTAGTATASGSYLLQALVPASFSFSVYGRIPARQAAVPNAYTDSLLITVSY